VVEWLKNSGVNGSLLAFTASQDWISVTLPISTIENLLQTEYHIFQDEDVFAVRAPEWSLPEHLHDHIECIQPTSSFFQASALAQKRNLQFTDFERPENSEDFHTSTQITSLPALGLERRQVCNASDVTPLCLRTLYGTIDYVPQVPENNSMALTNYLGQFNNRSDIYIFLSQYRPDAVSNGWDFTDVSIAGGVNQQSPANADQLKHGKGKEGNLDAEVMLGIAYPTPLTIYSTLSIPPPFRPTQFAPNNTNEPYLIWLNYMLALPDEALPKVISTSYGDIEHTLPLAYARRVCNGFAQLGVRGVRVIFGSGDSGVGRDGVCHSNKNDGSEETLEFLTRFPDCCPFVTSVGATMGIAPEEVAVHDSKKFVSGGGFSHYFPRPRWQDGVVDQYIDNLGDLHKGLYNSAGAAYPDVSVQGYQYAIVWNGTKKPVDGTSASAPTFAAILTIISDALIADGKAPLGFLNPWIWQTAKMGKGFMDVTVGSNKGCNTSGFPAQRGWDAASGWGTPVSPFMFRSL
jgi:tripeptidyl-peptidase-1